MALKLCPGCNRHARVELAACPFCNVPLPTTAATRSGLGMALGVALVACGPSLGEPQAEGGETTRADASSGADTTSSSSVGSLDTGDTGDTGIDTGSTSIGDDDPCGDSCCGFYGGCVDFGGFEPSCDLEAQDCPVDQ
jgi:hypothetical protein